MNYLKPHTKGLKVSTLFIMLLISVTCLSSCANSQDKGNSKAASAFKKKYPEASSVDWEIDDHGNTEAQFKMNGEKFRADFTPDGKWIETENSIDWDDLPSTIQEIIKKSYEKDDITEIEWVDHYSKGIFYDVEFKQKGKNMDIEFNKDGKRLN